MFGMNLTYFFLQYFPPRLSFFQKVPRVPGLLTYRKDTKKVYVRSNKTWNVIGKEKKVTECPY